MAYDINDIFRKCMVLDAIRGTKLINEKDNMASEFLPCPFCGGIPSYHEESCGGHNDGNRWLVECKCGAQMSMGYWSSKEGSKELWNTRVGNIHEK